MESFNKSKYWLLSVDDVMDFCWSMFLKMKDEASKRLIRLIKDLKATHGVTVKKIHCDNVGENKEFQK